MRVLHCPSSVGGNAQGLAKAERRLGLDSHCTTFRKSPFGYDTDECLYSSDISPLRFEARRWRLFLRALRDYDVIHFNFGRTIMPSLDSEASASAFTGSDVVRRLYSVYARFLEFGDLAWLKRAGKCIAVTFQGDDARQGTYCREHFDIGPTSHVPSGYYTDEKDARRRSIIERFDRYADLIFALNPDLLHVLPDRAQFLPYAHIDFDDWEPRVPASSDPIVIAHAPTHEGVKGTSFITRAVEKLRQQGLRFEFRLLRGLSHAEVREALAACDVLVDQLLLGWYGGVAVEAMALGIPVICYLREDDLQGIPPDMRKEIPIVRATPTDIGEVLERCVRLGEQPLREMGRKSREYVEKWHDPLAIARMVSEQYESMRHL